MSLQDRAQEISKAIDDMQGVCSEARESIRNLFRAMGVEFPDKVEPPELKAGQIHKHKNTGELLIIVQSLSGNLTSKQLLSGQHWDINAEIFREYYTFLANSLKEYLDNGGEV